MAFAVSHREKGEMSVYTLELEGDNYYVGFSDDVPRRVAEHFLLRGAHWTRLHRPVKVLEVVPGNKDLENAKTIALMCRLGWRKVRGGAWCATELKSMPIPLARALSQKPPKELPADKGRGARVPRAGHLRAGGRGGPRCKSDWASCSAPFSRTRGQDARGSQRECRQTGSGKMG